MTPWRRTQQPAPAFLPGKPRDGGAWPSIGSQRDTAERLILRPYIYRIFLLWARLPLFLVLESLQRHQAVITFQVAETFLNVGCGCVQETPELLGSGVGPGSAAPESPGSSGKCRFPGPHLTTCTWSWDTTGTPGCSHLADPCPPLSHPLPFQEKQLHRGPKRKPCSGGASQSSWQSVHPQL